MARACRRHIINNLCITGAFTGVMNTSLSVDTALTGVDWSLDESPPLDWSRDEHALTPELSDFANLIF